MNDEYTEEYVRIGEVCKVLGLSVSTVRNMTNEGKIPYKRVGRRLDLHGQIVGERRYLLANIYALRREIFKNDPEATLRV